MGYMLTKWDCIMGYSSPWLKVCYFLVPRRRLEYASKLEQMAVCLDYSMVSLRT